MVDTSAHMFAAVVIVRKLALRLLACLHGGALYVGISQFALQLGAKGLVAATMLHIPLVAYETRARKCICIRPVDPVLWARKGKATVLRQAAKSYINSIAI
jgi:hypothetical protein